MTAIEIIAGALLIVSAICIIILVLLQEGRQAGISGAIAGGAETFLGKNKGRSIEAKLARWTKVVAISFFLITLGANIAIFIIKK